MKKCRTCKETKNKSEFYPHKRNADRLFGECKGCCRVRHKKWHQVWYPKNKELQKKRNAEWIKNNYQKAQKMWCESGKKYTSKERTFALEKYGGKCVCCGEKEPKFLSFDHINGGGSQHRKVVGGRIVRWLKKNNYPEDFQILCHNCNLAKGFYGQCPHATNK